MTNQEYEAACVTAAKCYDRFEGEHKLKSVDVAIGHAEALLARLQEQRREIVNQYSINKHCSAVLRSQGKVYPRTCQVHGITCPGVPK